MIWKHTCIKTNLQQCQISSYRIYGDFPKAKWQITQETKLLNKKQEKYSVFSYLIDKLVNRSLLSIGFIIFVINKIYKHECVLYIINIL